MNPQILMTLEVGRKPSVMRVERVEREPATGPWNWLRRRKTIVKRTLLGVFHVDGDMRISRKLNAPSTLELSYRGRDPFALLERRVVE